MPAPVPPVATAAELLHGPSAEMRRFSAGMRAIMAMLVTLILFGGSEPYGRLISSLLLAYPLWAAWVLWAEASGRTRGPALWHYIVDVGWTAVLLQLTDDSTHMLTLTLVQPVVLASIGFGVRRGVQLALLASAAVIADLAHQPPRLHATTLSQALTLLGVLGLVPAAALLARPMSVLRQRLALVADIETTLDPRRGLEAVAALLVQRLREGTGAQVVGLVLPSATGAPAVLCSALEEGFRTSAEVHQQLEALLADCPPHPVTHVRRRRWRPLRGTRVHGGSHTGGPGLQARMDSLASLLEVRVLVVVPLTRYQRRHGHLLLGLPAVGSRHQDVVALSHAAPELLRIVEQATLVDQLQEESASHERARIGRDLHDSAIQPYLGLKYAVECVALRIPADNPARREVDSLADLVNGEVSALRELISGLRSDAGPGDNALVPAVRRQVRRFALLFSIDVEIDCPDALATTRALADALFHMVNEALNNIRKHSPARRVWIRLWVEGANLHLAVRDDGGSQRGRPDRPFHPVSLSERVTELGGTLHINQPDGLNTELVIQVPL
ncbi:MAG: histidine kinase [Pseudomonadota bacterium]